MRKEMAGGLLTVSLVAGGALTGAALASDAGEDRVATGREGRVTAGEEQPDGPDPENYMRRISGPNRYATAVAVADAYLWDVATTEAVYIANGLQFPDSLVLGLSNFEDGPLLLVRPDSIPIETRNALEELRPCYIDVIGGEAAVSNAVWLELTTYIDLDKCAV